MNVILYYRDLAVARVTECYFTDNTWYGQYHCELLGQGESEARLSSFLRFSEDWTNRWNADVNNPPDPVEFDVYADLLQPEVWSIHCMDGNIYHLDNAPNFVGNKEVSWRVL